LRYVNQTNNTQTLKHSYTTDNKKTCTDCAQNCATGKYRSGCGGADAGTCEDCSAPTAGTYITGHGGLSDSCPTSACTDCATGQYKSGCGGTSAGTCASCTNAASGQYYTSHGGRSNSCPVANCETTCPVGQYRSGCSGTSAGSCTSCTNAPANSYYTSNGGLSDSCSYVVFEREARELKMTSLCHVITRFQLYHSCHFCHSFISQENRSNSNAQIHTQTLRILEHQTLEHRYEICLSNCGVGQYRSGCSGTSPGSCIACTGLPANQYWTSTGGLTDTCSKQSCDSSSCGVGYFLSGCGGM
jgi:hypothetical protein